MINHCNVLYSKVYSPGILQRLNALFFFNIHHFLNPKQCTQLPYWKIHIVVNTVTE